MKPLAIDLYCGLGGWAEGLIAEGWDVVGFDIERHEYSGMKYPGQLVIQDARTLHGSQFKDADLIVGSSPCQRYSYMAMPWQRAKAQAAEIRADLTGNKLLDLNELFDTQFRIQREACAAVGGHIPMVVENVKGAQPWVGSANWHFGSFYLWGDVPALMPIAQKRGSKIPGFRFDGNGGSFQTAAYDALKNSGGSWFGVQDGKTIQWNDPRDDIKNAGGSWFNQANNTASGHARNPVHALAKEYSGDEGGGVKMAGASGAAWFDLGPAAHSSGSKARKAASAMIAKIPLPLSQHIARVYKPKRG